MAELIDVPPGLADVAVTDTEVGDVLGHLGYYHYRGIAAPELARTESFESVAAFVLDGADEPLDGDRGLPEGVVAHIGDLDLRTALSLLAADIGCEPLSETDPPRRREQAVRLISAFPTLVASVHHGHALTPDPGLSIPADYLRMLTGARAPDEHVDALRTYLVLTIDHGFNNSTFATRVVASTGADLGACVVAGFGALSGPRHGAALTRILDMFDGIAAHGDAEEWMTSEMAQRRRIQGFGHSVYRKPDPRLELLREIGARIAGERFDLAMVTEQAGIRLLAPRRLVPNVDLHAAVVLEACGIPRELFGATFAVARMVGWCANALEQAQDAKIIRPAARYVGPTPRDPVY